MTRTSAFLCWSDKKIAFLCCSTLMLDYYSLFPYETFEVNVIRFVGCYVRNRFFFSLFFHKNKLSVQFDLCSWPVSLSLSLLFSFSLHMLIIIKWQLSLRTQINKNDWLERKTNANIHYSVDGVSDRKTKIKFINSETMQHINSNQFLWSSSITS